MGMAEAARTCFRKYATFSGRARRPEYWWFLLFVVLVSIAAAFVDGVLFGWGTPEEPATRIVQPLWQLATFVPLLAAGWRRMHDTGRSGILLLLPIAISIGLAALFLLGILGAGLAGVTPADPEAVRLVAGSALFALVAGLVQLVVTILLIWWLTRPTQPDPNAWGPPPPAAPPTG